MVTASPPAEVSFEERYRAICARDSRFNGHFFFGVTTTGIWSGRGGGGGGCADDRRNTRHPGANAAIKITAKSSTRFI